MVNVDALQNSERCRVPDRHVRHRLHLPDRQSPERPLQVRPGPNLPPNRNRNRKRKTWIRTGRNIYSPSTKRLSDRRRHLQLLRRVQAGHRDLRRQEKSFQSCLGRRGRNIGVLFQLFFRMLSSRQILTSQ